MGCFDKGFEGDKVARKVIYRIKIGSHLYGLQHAESDTDYMEVFLPSPEEVLSLHPIDEVDNSTKSSSSEKRNSPEDVDDKSYSYAKYLHMLLGNNPNIIETIFATGDNILTTSGEIQELLIHPERIVSQRISNKFFGYALSQKAKLQEKYDRYESLRTGLAEMEKIYSDALGKHYAIDDMDAATLNKILRYYKSSRQHVERFHKGLDLDMIHDHVASEFKNYGWRVKTDTFETLHYDIKNGYHCLRVLGEGVELLKTGRLEYPVTGRLRVDILAIRAGTVDLDHLFEMYESYKLQYDEAVATCTLRKDPDYDWANKLLVDAMQRHIVDQTDDALVRAIKR
jgi:uncharacterized protein